MSMLLTAQALKLKVGNPTRKLVLVKLADNANDEGECFPSYQYIADHCEVSRRSVISHIEELIKMGLVEKKSRKNQDGSSSNLYILRLEKGGEKTSPPSENGSLPPSENISPITNHSINQSINHNTNLTVSNARTKKTSEFDLLEQFGIEGDLATDFVKHRKACKAPITKTALTGFKREAEKAGISIQQAVTIAIERGWRGFNASWQWREGQSNSGVIAKNPQNLTACQRNNQDIQDTSGWSAGLTIDDGKGDVCQF